MAFDPNKVNLGADLLTNPTASDRDPWQEAFKRFSAVPESKVLRASEALAGMTGSWAAQYKIGPSITDNSGLPETTAPSDFQMKCNKLGRPGMPEIDFVPYSHNTNRFGNKGGALLGEPISFSVVGPTAKVGGQNMIWQWSVNTTLVPGSFVILLDNIVVDTSVPIWTTKTRTSDITDYYGIELSDFATRFDGGLYLMIQESGYTDQIDPTTPVTGGVGDGAVIQDDGALPGVRVSIQPKTSNSKTELFRIVDLYESGGNVLGFVLDTSKNLESYFDLNGGAGELNIIRHLMLVEPAATRLVAIPDSGGGRGREQVFAFTPPRRALTSEHQMVASDWSTIGSSEYPWGLVTNSGASQFFYDYSPQLPIQKPYAEWGDVFLYDETVFSTAGFFANVSIQWVADVTLGEPLPEVGDILKIHSIQTDDGETCVCVPSNGRSVQWGSILGCFEVESVIPFGGTTYGLSLRRYVEVNPVSGNSFWGVSRQFSAAVTNEVPQLKCTLHKPVKELWNNPWFDADDLDSTRLTSIIDPRWVERAGIASDDLTHKNLGVSPYQPDRVVFDTSSSNSGADGTNADPGNLQNLGFRVVLFPGKIKTVPTLTGTEDIIAPDWDRPITSNEVTIDPSVNEKQYIEVDYANGFVRLSHPPQAVDVTDPNAGDLAPLEDIFTLGTDDNPRGELVLFAACVPYTQNIGQIGSGPRITANPASVSSTNSCASSANSSGSGEFYDVYGERVAFDIDTSSPQTLDSINVVGTYDEQLILTGLLADQLPPTGFFEIFQGGDPVLTTGKVRGSLFGYYGVVESGGNTILHGVHGGLEATVDSVTVSSINPAQIILRRELYTPNDLYGTATILYQDDVTYGDAKRAGTLRFTGVDIVVNLDGSVTVQIQDTAVDAYDNLGDLFSSWLLEGGELTPVIVGAADGYANGTEATIIYQGRRLVIPSFSLYIGDFTGPGTVKRYIYIDGSDCSIGASSSIPLTDPEYVLLGSVTFIGPAPLIGLSSEDLRYPLLDVDRRLDIFVGNRDDGTGALLPGPHFTTLAAAVDYVSALQNPTSGNSDFRVRIRVVGYTEEAAVPIMIGTDSLTIESDPSLDTSHSIMWSADDSPLIDMSGHDDLTFEGLSFRSTSTDTSNTEPIRALFANNTRKTDAGKVSRRCKIHNCRLSGSQGFMAMTSSHLEDFTITDNYCEDLLDFGIFLSNETEDPIELTAPTGGTIVINIDSGGSMKVSNSEGSVLLIDDTGGTIVYDGASSCTVTATAGGSISIKETTAGQVEAFSGGSFVGPTTINFDTDSVGSIFHNLNDVTVKMSSRLFERTIIRNNTFIQAGTIGNMAGNDRTLGVDTATITLSSSFTLRVGDDDGAIAVGVPPVLHGYKELTGITPFSMVNDGTNVDIQDSTPTTLLRLRDGETAAFYPVSGSTGTATISIPGQDDIVMTPDTWGYLYYSGTAGSRELRFLHGPNGVAVAGGIVAHTDIPVTDDWTLLLGSVMVNMHNQIDHNTIRGFHVGIFSNAIWNSSVTDNYVSDTKNIGIYLGPYAGYNSTDNNVLETVFLTEPLGTEVFQWPAQLAQLPDESTYPTAPFGTPIKYGLVAGGLYSNATANSTYISVTTPVSYPLMDIWLVGAYVVAKSNITVGCIGGVGSYLKAEGNTVLGHGAYGDVINLSISFQAPYSIIQDNNCAVNIALNDSSNSTIARNVATDIFTANSNLTVSAGSSYVNIMNNQVLDIRLGGAVASESMFCTVGSNTCQNIFNGDGIGLGHNGVRIVNNVVGVEVQSEADGTNVNIIGNTVLGTISINDEGCVISNNYADIININASDATHGPANYRKVIISSNHVADKIIGQDITTPATTPDYTVVVGNTVSAGLTMFGHSTTGVHTIGGVFEEAHNREW